MACDKNAGGRTVGLSDWGFAAALGLLAVAFFWDRSPTEKLPFPSGKKSTGGVSPTGFFAESEDRGRQAATPSEIPAKGWKHILLRVYANISKHRVLALAAGMTYYSILASFPPLRH